MLQFILRRVGMVIPTFIGITLLTFIFVHLIPETWSLSWRVSGEFPLNATLN